MHVLLDVGYVNFDDKASASLQAAHMESGLFSFHVSSVVLLYLFILQRTPPPSVYKKMIL